MTLHFIIIIVTLQSNSFHGYFPHIFFQFQILSMALGKIMNFSYQKMWWLLKRHNDIFKTNEDNKVLGLLQTNIFSEQLKISRHIIGRESNNIYQKTLGICFVREARPKVGVKRSFIFPQPIKSIPRSSCKE